MSSSFEGTFSDSISEAPVETPLVSTPRKSGRKTVNSTPPVSRVPSLRLSNSNLTSAIEEAVEKTNNNDSANKEVDRPTRKTTVKKTPPVSRSNSLRQSNYNLSSTIAQVSEKLNNIVDTDRSSDTAPVDKPRRSKTPPVSRTNSLRTSNANLSSTIAQVTEKLNNLLDTDRSSETVVRSSVTPPISRASSLRLSNSNIANAIAVVNDESSYSVSSARDSMVSTACSVYELPPSLMSSPLITSRSASMRERRKSVRFTAEVMEHMLVPTNEILNGNSSEDANIDVPEEEEDEKEIVVVPQRRLHSHPVIMAMQLEEALEAAKPPEPPPEPVPEPVLEPIFVPVNMNLTEDKELQVPTQPKPWIQKFMITIDKEKENDDKITALFEENNAAIQQTKREGRIILGNILDDNTSSVPVPSSMPSDKTVEEILEAKYFLTREALLQKKRSEISQQTVIDVLKNHSELGPFLQFCCKDDLLALVNESTAVDFCHNDKLMQFQDFVTCIYVVLQGTITITQFGQEYNDETDEYVWDTEGTEIDCHAGSLVGRTALEGVMQWDCTGVNSSSESLSLSIIKNSTSQDPYQTSMTNTVKSAKGKDYTLSVCVIPIETVLKFIGLQTNSAKEHAQYFWKYTRLYNEIGRINKDYIISSMAQTYGKKRRSLVTDYRMMDVLGTAKIRKFPSGVDIFKQGQSRHFVYYLTKGSAKFVRHYPNWLNQQNGEVVPESDYSSIKLPSEIDTDLILSRGDFSFMDGEDEHWVKHMAKVDETILRSKTENPVLYENKKRKYSRFEFHKNSLFTLTKCELITIPLSEIVKSLSLFNNLLTLSNKKYSCINLSSEELLYEYYKKQEWLKEKAAIINNLMTEKQANKVADYFYCDVRSNLNVDYCQRHTPGAPIRPFTASIESQETAKYVQPEDSDVNAHTVNNSNNNTGRTEDSPNTRINARRRVSIHGLTSTANTLFVIAQPNYVSNSIHTAHTTHNVASYVVNSPRPQSTSATIGRSANVNNVDSVSNKKGVPKIVFGYGVYSRYVNDMAEMESDVFLTAGSGGGNLSPKRPQSARSYTRSANNSPRAPFSTFGSSRPSSSARPSTNNRKLRFPSTNNVEPSQTTSLPQRPQSAPSSRRGSRPVVAKLNLQQLNKELQEPPKETQIIANTTEEDQPTEDVPRVSMERRKAESIRISNVLDLVYEINETKKRQEEEGVDIEDSDSCTLTATTATLNRSEYLDEGRSTLIPDDPFIYIDEGEGNADLEVQIVLEKKKRPTSAGYGQVIKNAVKKDPDFYVKLYNERMINNSPKKRFMDEFMIKKL